MKPGFTGRRLQDTARVAASLDEPVGEDAVPLREFVADPSVPDPLDGAIAQEQRAELSTMLRLLPERQREVLIRRFGLGGRAPISHEEIGDLVGVGEERSRQLERDALQRLRSIGPACRLAA